MRIYLWISLGGFVVLAGSEAVFSFVYSGLRVLVFFLAISWTFGCLAVGIALLVARGIRRLAKRSAKPS